jgi:hypothetical protein
MATLESFVLTQKELHLGHLKETFRRGAVIEHDPVNRRLIIDGRRFDDTRDLDVLKRQAIKNPNNPWILPATQENVMLVLSLDGHVEAPQSKPRPGENMPIVQSDQDTVEPIDIRHTQISKIHQQQKADERTAAHDREVGRKMEIIRGDESVEDRIRRLTAESAARRAQGKPTDLSLQGELVRLKAQNRQAAPVVRDDSLGQVSGTARNAGQTLPSPDTAKPKDESIAEARKLQAEAARRRMTQEQEVDPEDLGAEVSALPPKDIPAARPADPEVEIASPTEKRVAALENNMGQMMGMMQKMMGMMQKPDAPAAPVAPTPPPLAGEDNVVRVPVTDPEVAKRLATKGE